MSNQQSLRKLRQTYGTGNVAVAEAFVRLLKIKPSDKLYPSAIEWAAIRVDSSTDILTARELKEFNKDNKENRVGRIHKKIIEEIKNLYKINEVIQGIKPVTSSKLDQPISSKPLPNPSQSKELEPEIKLESNIKRVQSGGEVLLTWTSKNAIKIKKSNIPGVTTKSPVNGFIKVENIKRRRNFYISVISSSGKTSEAKVETLVETQQYKKEQDKKTPETDPPEKEEQPTRDRTSLTQMVSPSSKKQRKPKEEKVEESKSEFGSLSDGILLSINKSLNSIVKLLTTQLKANQRKYDKDRIASEARVRLGREEAMEEQGSSGLDMMKSGAEKMLSPFKSIIDKIVNFLFYTFLGRAFTEIVNWMNDPANKEKVEALGKFLKDFWPLIAGAAVLLFTPLGGFIVGTVQFLAGTFKTLKALGGLIKGLVPGKGGKGGTLVTKGKPKGKVPVTTSGGRKVGRFGKIKDAISKPFKGKPNITTSGGNRVGGFSGLRESISKSFRGAPKITGGLKSPIGRGGLVGEVAIALTQMFMPQIQEAVGNLYNSIGIGIGNLSDDQLKKELNYELGLESKLSSELLGKYFQRDSTRLDMLKKEAEKRGLSSGGSLGGTPFSGLVSGTSGIKVSGAGKDTQAFPIMGGGMAILQKGETVLQPGVRETIIKEKGFDVLSYNKGSNANKPINLNSNNITAMNTGGIVGGPKISPSDYNALLAISALESDEPQGRADAAQSIYNRLLAATKYGTNFLQKSNTIKGLITADQQYQPTFSNAKDWNNINDDLKSAVIAVMNSDKGKRYKWSYQDALNQIKATEKALKNPVLQKNAQKFVKGLPSFRGTSQHDFIRKDLGDVVRNKNSNFFTSFGMEDTKYFKERGSIPAPIPSMLVVKPKSIEKPKEKQKPGMLNSLMNFFSNMLPKKKYGGLIDQKSGNSLSYAQDNILMRAEKGEYVMPRIAVEKIGVRTLDRLSSLDPNFRIRSSSIDVPRPLSRSNFGAAPLMLPPINQGGSQGGISGASGNGTQVPSFSATPRDTSVRMSLADLYGILTN